MRAHTRWHRHRPVKECRHRSGGIGSQASRMGKAKLVSQRVKFAASACLGRCRTHQSCGILCSRPVCLGLWEGTEQGTLSDFTGGIFHSLHLYNTDVRAWKRRGGGRGLLPLNVVWFWTQQQLP